MTNIKRPRAKNLNKIDPESLIQKIKPNVKFNDIIGCMEASRILKDFSFSLKESDNYYSKFGCFYPKGILLHGPGGCGKTLLARAFCYNTNALFYNIKTCDVLVRWFSETENNLNLIIQDARERSKEENVPAVLYFDEISSLFSISSEFSREGLSLRLSHVLNEAINGFDEEDAVYILGGTRNISLIHPDVLSPSVFPYQIKINKPKQEERKKYFDVLSKEIVDNSSRYNWINIDSENLASRTQGMSYLDIKNLFNNVLMRKAKAWKNSDTSELRRDSKLLNIKNEDFNKFVPEKNESK